MEDFRIGRSADRGRPSGTREHLKSPESVSYTHLDVYKRQGCISIIMQYILILCVFFFVIIKFLHCLGLKKIFFTYHAQHLNYFGGTK